MGSSVAPCVDQLQTRNRRIFWAGVGWMCPGNWGLIETPMASRKKLSRIKNHHKTLILSSHKKQCVLNLCSVFGFFWRLSRGGSALPSLAVWRNEILQRRSGLSSALRLEKLSESNCRLTQKERFLWGGKKILQAFHLPAYIFGIRSYIYNIIRLLYNCIQM